MRNGASRTTLPTERTVIAPTFCMLKEAYFGYKRRSSISDIASPGGKLSSFRFAYMHEWFLENVGRTEKTRLKRNAGGNVRKLPMMVPFPSSDNSIGTHFVQNQPAPKNLSIVGSVVPCKALIVYSLFRLIVYTFGFLKIRLERKHCSFRSRRATEKLP